MESREPCPPRTDIQRLEQVGFSHEQITGLLRVKALSERGASHQAEPLDKRQAFIRWLSLQGRLQSEEPLSYCFAVRKVRIGQLQVSDRHTDARVAKPGVQALRV